MLLGTQYFRQPGPDPADWPSDFAQMSEMGLSLVRFWVFWSSLNPAPDKWEWGDLDRLFDLASEHGLGVIVQLVPENQPRWFIERNANLLPRDPAGTPSQLLSHTIAAAGAYPGITFEHSESQTGMAGFIEEVVQRYKGHSALHTWDVWNEIQPYSVSFDDVTTRAWQRWLSSRFVTIDDFRAYTQVDVSDFAQVPLVRTDHREDQGNGTLPLRHVYREWLSSRMVGEMQRRSSLVRKIDRVHPIASHRRGATFIDPVVDDAELANVVDMWGTSNHVAHTYSPRDLRELALKLALVRGASADKPFWLAETFSGRLFHGYGHYSPTGVEIESNLSLAFAHGASSAVLWQYRHESFGSEMAGWGLVNFDGSLNERTEAVARVSAAIRRLHQKGVATVRRPSSVGLLYDPAVLNMERSLDEENYPQLASITEELTGWFIASQDAGISADIYTTSRVLRDGFADELKVLILPLNAIANPSVSRRVLDWVSTGGTLVLTAFTEMLSDGLVAPSVIPSGNLGRALGSRIVSREYPRSRFGIEVKDLNIAGHLVSEEFEIGERSEVLGYSQRKPAIVRTGYGDGSLLYIGTLPGTGYLTSGGELPRWINQLVPSGADNYSTINAHNIFFEKLNVNRGELLFAFNPTSEPGVFELNLASPGASVEDVKTSIRPTRGQLGTWRFDVPARDCIWLLIEESAEEGRDVVVGS